MFRNTRTWALDVADDASGGVVHELDTDLGNTSSGTYNTKPISNPFARTSFLPSIAPLPHGNAPVRPKTRVTFTSLTGTLEESIVAICSRNQYSVLFVVGSGNEDLCPRRTDCVNARGFGVVWLWLEVLVTESSCGNF